MDAIQEFIESKLKIRSENHNLRSLPELSKESIDFLSNDFFSLSRDGLIRNKIQDFSMEIPQWVGSSGSRLLSGNTNLHIRVESVLGNYLDSEQGLFFTNGYLANLSLLSALGDKRTLFFVDSQIHASMKEGCNAGFGKKISFRHNDMNHLEKVLSRHASRDSINIVLTEGLFSMQGDLAPLGEILDLCHQYNAGLVVDEAHSLGICGPTGLGASESIKNHPNLLARVFPLGKGPGVMGAYIACSSNLKSFLINFARPFIYSTAPSSDQLIAVLASIELMKERTNFLKLQSKIDYFLTNLPTCGNENISRNLGPIQFYRCSDKSNLMVKSQRLKENRIACLPIFSPTVPEGEERLRIILHAHNRKDEIDLLLRILMNN